MKKIILTGILFMNSIAGFSQTSLNVICDRLAEQYLGKKSGALVIGVYHNGVNQIFYYGETEKGNHHKPDSNSIFELGNLTESFTCILYADQVMKGLIHDDDRLLDYLPDEITAPANQTLICEPYKKGKTIEAYSSEDNMRTSFTPYICLPDTSNRPQQILLCNLGSHSSGLPDKPFNFHSNEKSDPYADYSTDDLYEFLRMYRLRKPAEFDYRHSDLGIAILGKAMSLKLKKNFETLLIENIFDSLKMNDTRIILSESQHQRQITGHSSKGKATNYWSADVYAPVFGLHSSPSDMMKFLLTNIAMRKNHVTDLFEYTHKPRLKPGKSTVPGLEIGLGWKINPIAEVQNKVVWQSGMTGGFASYVGFIETNHTGVFILSSVAKEVTGIGVSILKSFEQENLLTK